SGERGGVGEDLRHNDAVRGRDYAAVRSEAAGQGRGRYRKRDGRTDAPSPAGEGELRADRIVLRDGWKISESSSGPNGAEEPGGAGAERSQDRSRAGDCD